MFQTISIVPSLLRQLNSLEGIFEFGSDDGPEETKTVLQLLSDTMSTS